MGGTESPLSRRKKWGRPKNKTRVPRPPKMAWAWRLWLLFSGPFPEMAVSAFLSPGDPERLVSGVGRGRGGPCSQSMLDVVCQTRRDWLAITSCCSSGWGQRRVGGCWKSRGEVTMVIAAVAADREAKQWRREFQGSSLTFSPVLARGEGPGSASAELWGAGVDEETQFLP